MKLRQILTAPNQLTLLRIGEAAITDDDRAAPSSDAPGSDATNDTPPPDVDGLLARTLHQQTLLGQYLDPIADKLLMSTMFLVLSIEHMIPWKYTVVVFSRDVSILLISGVLFTIAGLRDFRPSIFGKANTFAQVAAVFCVLLLEVHPARWVWIARLSFLRAVFAFTIVSGLHYVFIVGQRLHGHSQKDSASVPAGPGI